MLHTKLLLLLVPKLWFYGTGKALLIKVRFYLLLWYFVNIRLIIQTTEFRNLNPREECHIAFFELSETLETYCITINSSYGEFKNL